jgi:hypothetical protein
MRIVSILVLTAVLSFLSSYAESVEHEAVDFPLQFSGSIQITSNLIDEASTYPPRIRRMHVHYDYINKRARADIEGGYEVSKTCKINIYDHIYTLQCLD